MLKKMNVLKDLTQLIIKSWNTLTVWIQRTKTRKRQLDEGSDTEINTSKRSHLDSETSDQERKDEESYMDVTTNEESHEEDGVHSSQFTPAAKIIHPASFLNSLNKSSANSALRPANLATGIVRSFIKRNAPPQPTMEELHNRRKMALEEKERLHQERLKYRDLQHKRKMEELKRKREEKMKKAAELREKRHSEGSRHRMLLNRKMHQKEQVLEAMKEEKLKEEREKHKIRYEMTPVRMHRKSPSEDNYDISNLHSDDSTDDEDAPRKKIPLWAQGAHLKAALINQHYHPPNLERMFPHIDPPDLNLLFEKKRARFNKRTSSAHWDSPILLPCKI